MRFYKYDSHLRLYFVRDLETNQEIAGIYEKLFAWIKETTDTYLKLCLLCILVNKLHQKKETDISDLNDFFNILIDGLPKIFEIIQKVISVNYINESIFEYIDTDASSWLEEIINKKNIVSSLETLSRREKDRLNCLAIATVGKRKYFSINGLDGQKFNRIREVISGFLEGYRAVEISDGVRYYLDDEKEYITYKQSKEKRVKENRMFTCCERKLFAQMRIESKLNNDVEIIVTSHPCEYCLREINFINENYNKILNVIYPREEYVSRHDQIAREIWWDNN